VAGRTNLAGPAGRWSAGLWKTATFGWLAFAVVAVVVGSAVGTRNLTDAETASGQAAKTQRILASAGFNAPATESLLVQSRTATHDKPEFNAVVGQFVLTVSGQANVTNIVAPFEHPNAPGRCQKAGIRCSSSST
jgi:RND superfamily putative drug exporter